MRQWYSKRHFDRLSNGGPDKPGAKEERVHQRMVAEQAHAETVAEFAPFTSENIKEALKWQERRIAQLMAATPK
jgi:hypothetical protein